MDLDGVALSAIQGLYQTLQEKEALIITQQEKLQNLEIRLTAPQKQMSFMESRIAEVENAKK